MCQLTLIDFRDQKISKFIVKPLTELNTIGINAQSNNDGFGYVCFSNLENIVKSKLSAQIWWNTNKPEWKKNHRNVNGIYHVRACSTTHQKIGDEFSHPFTSGNLIQIHNGTLNEIYRNNRDKEIKDLIKNQNIDSQNFLEILNHYVETSPPLKPQHINSAIKHWSGTMALMLIDKRKPTKVTIVKDDTKSLFLCTFKIKKEPVGVIINTQKFEIEYVAELIADFLDNIDKTKITWEITELPKSEISEYTIGSYTAPIKLEELKPYKETIIAATVHALTNRHQNDKWNDYYEITSPSLDIIDIMKQLGISYLELQLISEVCFERNFFLLNENEINLLTQFLEHLNKTIQTQAKFILWQEITKNNSKYEIYKKGKIFFPYFLTNKKLLKKINFEVKYAKKSPDLPL